MVKRESEIERALVSMVNGLGGRCMKWVCPGFSGVPDRICLIPGGHICFVETKRETGGKVSGLQKYWRKVLSDLGFSYYLVKDSRDLTELRIILLAEIAGG